VAIVPGGNSPRGGNCPGGNCPVTGTDGTGTDRGTDEARYPVHGIRRSQTNQTRELHQRTYSIFPSPTFPMPTARPLLSPTPRLHPIAASTLPQFLEGHEIKKELDVHFGPPLSQRRDPRDSVSPRPLTPPSVESENLKSSPKTKQDRNQSCGSSDESEEEEVVVDDRKLKRCGEDQIQTVECGRLI
jgi:hypothetical protein